MGAVALAAVLVGTAVPGAANAQPTLDSLYRAAIAAGEKEVTVYGPPSSRLRAEFAEHFGARFPDVTLNYSGMPGNQLVSKVAAEAKAGVNAVDVMISGTSTLARGPKAQGLLGRLDDVIVVPDVLRGANWLGGRLAFADDEHSMLVMTATVTVGCVVNTDQVGRDEILSDADLLDPKWKGRIVANDPLLPGASNVTFRRLYDLYGADYITRLVKEQEVAFVANLRQPVDWVAKGRYAVVIGASPTIVNEFIAKGVTTLGMEHNARWRDKRSTSSGFGQLAVAARPAHPAATRLFINWLLSREGQIALGTGLEYSSRRLNAEVPSVPAVLRVYPGTDYLEQYSVEWSLHPNGERLRALMRQLMAAK